LQSKPTNHYPLLRCRSAGVKEDEIAQLLKSGAEDFIRKPFNITELTDKITAVLQIK